VRTAAQILAEHRIVGRGNKSVFATTCPQCSHARRKKRDRCLSVLIDGRGVRANCHHCQWVLAEFFDGPRAPIAASKPTIVEHDGDDDQARIRRARQIWEQSVDPTGTLVGTYLAGRKLHLPACLVGRVIRFYAACPWRDDDTDRLIHVRAMIAAMRDIRSDELRAVQVTALGAHGAKIARKIRGVAAGAAIKLDPHEAVTMGLGVAEGFENALVPYLMGWHPVWALGSAGAIAEFPALPGIECLTIFADHDENRTGEDAARTCAEIVRSSGTEVVVRLSKAKDWNASILGRSAT